MCSLTVTQRSVELVAALRGFTCEHLVHQKCQHKLGSADVRECLRVCVRDACYEARCMLPPQLRALR